MPGFTLFKGQVGFGWRSEIVGGLRLENYCSLHNRADKLPTPSCPWLEARRLASGFFSSPQLSLLAAAGVLVLPFGFWVVSLVGGAQIIAGIRIAKQPLLIAELS